MKSSSARRHSHDKRGEKALPKKRARREEIDTFYLFAAAVSAMLDAEQSLKDRTRMIPGGWLDLRLIRTKMEELMLSLLHTFEPDKQRQISKQMHYIRLKTVFCREASKDPEMMMLETEDVATTVHAAGQECMIRMCPASECKRCQLGRALDRASFVSRGDAAWWEVFERAGRGELEEETEDNE